MINFYDGQIADLLPHNLTDDPAVQAVSLALRDGTRLLHHYTQLVYTYCSIDTAPDMVLDLLARELRTQYYADSLDIETKRGLIRNTLIWYMTAGTPAAVEELVAVVFGEGEVKEWFEYNGAPYCFKIKTNATLTPDIDAYFSEMIRRVKNTRSHLEAIEIHREIEQPYYAGVGGLSQYKPAAIIDGYKVGRDAQQDINSGAAAESIYKPAPIIDGYKETRSAEQTAYAGAGSFGSEKPAAVMENLKTSGAVVEQTIYAGQAFNSAYSNIAKEE